MLGSMLRATPEKMVKSLGIELAPPNVNPTVFQVAAKLFAKLASAVYPHGLSLRDLKNKLINEECVFIWDTAACGFYVDRKERYVLMEIAPGVLERVHRVACWLRFGSPPNWDINHHSIPPTWQVIHKESCQTLGRRCCITHVQWGTNGNNMDDKAKRKAARKKQATRANKFRRGGEHYGLDPVRSPGRSESSSFVTFVQLVSPTLTPQLTEAHRGSQGLTHTNLGSPTLTAQLTEAHRGPHRFTHTNMGSPTPCPVSAVLWPWNMGWQWGNGAWHLQNEVVGIN
jgi:hypothetical protein